MSLIPHALQKQMFESYRERLIRVIDLAETHGDVFDELPDRRAELKELEGAIARNQESGK